MHQQHKQARRRRQETERNGLGVRAIHQIPSHYSKPRYLQGFHTSVTKPCGFGCPDGVSNFLDIHVKKVPGLSQAAGLVVIVLSQGDGQMGMESL